MNDEADNSRFPDNTNVVGESLKDENEDPETELYPEIVNIDDRETHSDDITVIVLDDDEEIEELKILDLTKT